MPALPIGSSTPPTVSATATTHAGRRVRLTARRTVARRRCCSVGQRIGGRQRHAAGRQRDRAFGQALAPLPERDVDRPVGAADLAELRGAVQRVDDPQPVGLVPARVVGRLLRQHDVVGPGVGEQLEQVDVGPLVARVPQRPRVGEPQLLAQREQQLTCTRWPGPAPAPRRTGSQNHAGADGRAAGLVDQQERAGRPVAAVLVDEQRLRRPQLDPADLVERQRVRASRHGARC